MKRPNGQQCLAKALTVCPVKYHAKAEFGRPPSDSFYIDNYIAMKREVSDKIQTHRHTDTQTHRQCPILCLARFTEPLPDN